MSEIPAAVENHTDPLTFMNEWPQENLESLEERISAIRLKCRAMTHRCSPHASYPVI